MQPAEAAPEPIPPGPATSTSEPINLDTMYPESVLGPRTSSNVPYAPFPVPDGGCVGPDCGYCGGGCGECGVSCRPCGCGFPHRVWGRLEYMVWWADGMHIPHLVTTSPLVVPADEAGVLGLPNTRTVYGNRDILEDARSGWRLTLGAWFDCAQRIGVEMDYFHAGQDTGRFSIESDRFGAPVLARPYFNINPRHPLTGIFDCPAREDSQLVSYPEIIAGRVFVTSSTSLESFGMRLRRNVCCVEGCVDPCNQCGFGSYRKVDFIVGYRYLRLRDRLRINEDLISLDPEVPGEFDLSDSFTTRNAFHGLDFGVIWEASWHCWSLELLSKMAVGNIRQKLDINGRTYTSINGVEIRADRGGLLALESNIARRARNQFAVVPEAGFTLGYQFTRNLRGTFGYTVVYVGNVIRAGDQIDTDVNPDLIPEVQDPVTGALRPRFLFDTRDYWAQSLNFGLDLRF
jgi:hypothetical protein